MPVNRTRIEVIHAARMLFADTEYGFLISVARRNVACQNGCGDSIHRTAARQGERHEKPASRRFDSVLFLKL
jgi:hypothetical protein